MAITFCFCLGSLDDAISTPTGYAFIEVFYVITKSHIGATLLSSLIIFLTIFINLSIVATASRQLFAFARDKGLPFGRWIAYACSSFPSFSQAYEQCEISSILFSRNQANKLIGAVPDSRPCQRNHGILHRLLACWHSSTSAPPLPSPASAPFRSAASSPPISYPYPAFSAN